MPWDKQFNVDDALEKAMSMFWSRGYAATSMQDLVKAMGINRGSLYATYGDKRSLFVSALKRYDAAYRKTLLARLERLASAREAITGLFSRRLEDLVADHGTRGCFMTNTALEMVPHDAEVGRLVAESQAELEAFFRHMIERGQERGEFRADLDPVTLARGLLGSLLGLLVLAKSRPERELLEAVVEDALARLD